MMAKSAKVGQLLRQQIGAFAHLFRPDALNGIIAVTVQNAPELPVRRLAILAGLGAWICAFDDMIDDGDLDDRDIALRVEHYEVLLREGYCAELAFDPVADVVRAILARVQGHELRSVLEAQLVAACRAMAERTQPRSLDEYLRRGADSICLQPVLTLATILFDEDVTVAALVEMERHAAIAVRIANDLATWVREQREGATNALRITSEETLRQRMEDERVRLRHAAAAVARRTAAFAVSITNCLVEQYSRGDLDAAA